jgi:hypothetical protein
MQAVLVLGVSLGVFGVWQLGRRVASLLADRRKADTWLETATGDVVPSAYAWRAAQLESIANRRRLAKTLRAIVARAADGRSSLYRPRLTAVRRRRAAVVELAETLEQEENAVTPAGMIRVAELITNGAGPLWGSNPERLEREIESTLRVLVPRRSDLHAAC